MGVQWRGNRVELPNTRFPSTGLRGEIRALRVGHVVEAKIMATRNRKTSKGKAHTFGGDWTSTKLDVLAKYLTAYTTALKDKPTADRPFKKAYIDAFAGTGYRSMRDEDESQESANLVFPDLAEPAPQQLLDGSARLALKTEPQFDRYIFIDRSKDRVRQLELLKTEFPDLESKISVEKGDANKAIQKLALHEV